jgi:hypothetical protein
MISAAAQNLRAPFDRTALYWISPPRESWSLYSPAAFFFASDDGARLVPAMKDELRFISALTTAITDLAEFDCVDGLEKILAQITAVDAPPPPPRYPSVGDTGVSGVVEGVGYFLARRKDADTGQWVRDIPTWAGFVRADIAANGYSTPPANERDDYAFRICFSTGIEVSNGQAVTFNIEQGTYAPMATNVVPQ